MTISNTFQVGDSVIQNQATQNVVANPVMKPACLTNCWFVKMVVAGELNGNLVYCWLGYRGGYPFFYGDGSFFSDCDVVEPIDEIISGNFSLRIFPDGPFGRSSIK